MKVVLQAMCSECYQPVGLVLTEKSKNIHCPICGHEVPMLEQGSFVALARDQKKRGLFAFGSFLGFLAAAGGFVWYITEFEKEAGNTTAGIALMVLGGLVTLGLGWMASNRRYVCEF